MQIEGFSGIVGRETWNQRKNEARFRDAMKKTADLRPDVLLLHQGPDDASNRQPGAPFIQAFLERNGSSVVFFGRCHGQVPMIEIGAHQVLNVDNRLCLFVAQGPVPR